MSPALPAQVFYPLKGLLAWILLSLVIWTFPCFAGDDGGISRVSDPQAKALTGSDGVDPVIVGVVKLHEAVAAGDLQRVSALVQAGESIDRKDATGRTPLSLSLQLGHIEITGFLLSRGAIIGTEPPADGIPADVDYAVEPRFQALFHARLSSQQLVDLSNSPSDDLATISKLLEYSPPDFVWQYSCRNKCTNGGNIAGGATAAVTFVHSSRVNTPGSTIFRVSVPQKNIDDVKGSDLSAAFQRVLIRETIWTLRGGGTIQACEFSFAKPLCFPSIQVALADGTTTPIVVVQGGFSKRIAGGQSVFLDRSEGDVRINADPADGKTPSIGVVVKLANRPTIDFKNGFDLGARIANYVQLTKWSAKRLAALARGDRESLIEAKTLATSARLLSSKMKVIRYDEVVLQLFTQRANDVRRLDRRVLDLRKLVQAHVEYPPEEIDLMLQKVDALLASADPVQKLPLQSVQDALEKSKRAALATGAAATVATDSYFAEIDRTVSDYQALGLELAQYISPEALQAHSPLSSEERADLSTRIASTDVLVTNASFAGRGALVKRALGLP